MSVHRTMTATEAKTNFGEVLAFVEANGPVVVTRSGREIALISQARSVPNQDHLASLAVGYSAGSVTWPQIRDAHAFSFGELLMELRRQVLPLPTLKGHAKNEKAVETFVSWFTTP